MPSPPPITIDGSLGEGGGQVLRTSLALSIVTGKAFRLVNVRANRDRPGLRPQHLMAVRAAAEVGVAEVSGDAVGSSELTFAPAGGAVAGDYTFDIGTAGSTTLVLQTVLPPLLLAGSRSAVRLVGGTHNPHSPPFEFLERVFLPLIRRMGPTVTPAFERHGFYPAGGGRWSVTIEPAPPSSPRLAGFELMERGAIVSRTARAVVVGLPRPIAERELEVVQRRLKWPAGSLAVEEVAPGASRGNVLALEVASEHVTELISVVGQRGVAAEAVAEAACAEAERYLATDAPVGEHLADQLLLPLALAGGGAFRTGPLSLHARTNVEVIRRFLDVGFEVREAGEGAVVVRVRRG